jgi:RNase H-like domain found in reverse transcriptase/Reverse transcriptase (RNA-dependent DNA polymerase)/Integrase zinc binding domain/Integrase core domain/Retroviral aspartyl protease
VLTANHCHSLLFVNTEIKGLNGNSQKFLVDTGASVSLVTLEATKYQGKIEKIKSNLHGIGGKQKIKGKISLNIFGQPLQFYVIGKLPVSMHGILGANFFSSFNAKIDYGQLTLTIHKNGTDLSLPMQANVKKRILLPARCEVFRKCKIQQRGDCITIPEEVSEGVFIAGTIVRPKDGEIFVKFMNTLDHEVEICNFTPKIVLANDYKAKRWLENCNNVDRVTELFKELDLHHLDESEKGGIKRICAKFADIFHLSGDKLTSTDMYKQQIRLKPNSAPVYVKPYRLPFSQKEEIGRQIDKMLEDGIIEKSNSEWSSPILVVPKKSDENGNKKWRVVIDYRRLNEQILDDKFPLANITDILDSLGRAVYFSTLDLSQGYYQLEIEKKDRQCTAFVTDKGQYQMRKLPMGLKISPSAFSRLMTVALADLNYDKCFVYLDDIIVFGSNLETHNRNLTAVLNRLREVNLKLNPKKTKLLGKEVLYLGHKISAEGIAPDPQKIGVVENYPVPKNADGVKRFVAFANYYRKFIKDFSSITGPLNQLSKKNVRFDWTTKCQEAFDTLRKALYSSPILDYPDFSPENTFVLTTDGSRSGLGAVLSNANGRAVAYASRALNSAERNYSVTEIELLGNVWGIKHFRPYLFGRHFEVRTDHRPLVYLFSQVDPSSRLNKFRMALQEYDFTVTYIKGKDNVVADALSRIHVSELNQLHSELVSAKILVVTRRMAQTEKVSADERVGSRVEDENSVAERVGSAKKPLLGAKRSDQLQKRPTMCKMLTRPGDGVEIKEIGDKVVRDYTTNRSKSLWYSEIAREILIGTPGKKYDCVSVLEGLPKFCMAHRIRDLVIIDNEENRNLKKSLGVIRRALEVSEIFVSIVDGIKLVRDESERKLILNDFHMLPTGGHAGVTRMTKTIKQRFEWPGMAKDIQEFVKRCDACQRFKYSVNAREPLVVTTTATEAMRKIFMDIVGSIATDNGGFSYILTIQCELSKFITAVPLQNKEAKTVAKAFVENFILIYGVPKRIGHDCGTEFLAEIMKNVCKLLEIQQLASTPYHHQSIGALENHHKHMAAFLRIQVSKNPNSWSSWLPYWCFAYNATIHTQTGFSPYELVFGKLCILPTNLVQGENGKIEPLYNIEDFSCELKYRIQTAQAEAYKTLIKHKEKRKEMYDKDSRPKNIEVGDLVLVKNEVGKKLDCIYKGPFKVQQVEGPNAKLEVGNSSKIVHRDRIKKYITNE